MVKHIAIIPDGNRRWARLRGVSYLEAYRRGVEKIREVVRHVATRGLAEYVTFYVLSVENLLRRSRQELAILFVLLKSELKRVREDDETYSNGIRVRVIGIREFLPSDVIREIELTERATERNSRCTVILAVAYGGLYEPFHMLSIQLRRRSHSDLLQELLLESTEHVYREFTYLGSSEIPPPDIVVRTGGEMRLSNFLLPHVSGSRLVFLDKYWPDISVKDLDHVVELVEKSKDQYAV